MTPPEIRTIRESLGLQQTQAARLLGVDGRTWRRWEAGDRPMFGAAERLLRVMQAHPHIIETLQAMTGTEENRDIMTRDQIERLRRLESAGIDWRDAEALRRISMTLHRWHEMECGTDNGAVERDESDGKTYWLNAFSGKRHPTPDRETGALKRLNKIMTRYPTLRAYVQGDPRGAALYILRPDDVPTGANVDSYYSRGIAVY